MDNQSNGNLQKDITDRTQLNFGFSFLETLLTNYNQNGFTDINRLIENWFIPLLNLVYADEFIWLNGEKSNYKHIDLANRSHTVIIQVTTNTKSEKLIKCLEGVMLNYPGATLYYLILHEKSPNFLPGTLKKLEKFNNWFSPDKHLHNLNIITENILNLSAENRTKAVKYVSELTGNIKKDFTSYSNQKGYCYVDDFFWKYTSSLSGKDYLVKLNSHPAIICSAIQSNLTVKLIPRIHDGITESIWSIFEDKIQGDTSDCLLEIIGEPGVGKSTFMFQVAYNYRKDFDVIWVQNEMAWTSLAERSFQKPLLLLVNEIEVLENNPEAITIFNRSLIPFGCIMCIAERRDKWDQWGNRFRFRKKFMYNYQVEISLNKRLIRKVIKVMQQITGIKNPYSIDITNRWVISDYVIDFLLKNGHDLTDILKPDWESWSEITRDAPPEIKSLYDKVAFLNYYGVICPINKIYSYFNITYETFQEYLPEREGGVLTIQNGGLMLRHLKVAQWFFINQPLKLQLLQTWIMNSLENPRIIDIPISRKLLRSPNFQRDMRMPKLQVIDLLKKGRGVLTFTDEEYFKNCCEIAKIYYWGLQDKTAAYSELDRAKEVAKKDFIALEYLFRLSEDTWPEMGEELKSAYKLHPENPHIANIWKEFKLKTYKKNNVTIGFIAEEYNNSDVALDICLSYLFRFEAKRFLPQVKEEFAAFYSLVNNKESLTPKLLEFAESNVKYIDIIAGVTNAGLELLNPKLKAELFFQRCNSEQFEGAYAVLKQMGPPVESLDLLKVLIVKIGKKKVANNNIALLDELLNRLLELLEGTILPHNKKTFLYRYLEILYLNYDSYEKKEVFTRLFEQGIQEHKDNVFIKYQIIRYYLKMYEYEDVREKIDALIAVIPESSQDHPEYIMTLVRIAYSKEDFEGANELIARLSNYQDYAEAAIFIKINRLFYGQKYFTVINTIKENLYDIDNYYDSTSNEYFVKSIVLACRSVDELIALYQQNKKQCIRLYQTGNEEAALLFYMVVLFENRFENTEEFIKNLDYFKQNITNKTISYALLLIKLMAASGRFFILRKVLHYIRTTRSIEKYFHKNRLIIFLDLVGKLVNLNTIRLSSKRIRNWDKNRKAFLKPHGNLKNEYNTSLIEYYAYSLSRNNHKRRALLLIYIYWRHCSDIAKKAILFRMFSYHVREYSKNPGETIARVEYLGNNKFVAMYDNYSKEYMDTVLGPKLNNGWKSDKSFLNFDPVTLEPCGIESYFTIQTDEYPPVEFSSWLASVKIWLRIQ